MAAILSMNQLTDDNALDGEAKLSIRAGQVGLVFAAFPSSVVVNLISGIVLAAVQWNAINHTVISGWLFLLMLVAIFRWGLNRRFQAQKLLPEAIDRWQHLALTTIVLSGLLWGMAGLLLFPPESTQHQMFLVFIIAGMSAGAVTTLSALFPAVLFFILALIFPLLWSFFSLGSEIGNMMAGMAFLFMVMVIMSAHRLNQMIIETLTMRHERGLAEAMIRHQAFHDDLTDLPNRRMLLNQLKRELARSVRHDYLGAILFLDLDHFKNINDSLGHSVGDELLKQVARRLTQRLRNEDTVARLGGDEFVIILSEIGENTRVASAHAQFFASEIRQLFTEPFQVEGNELHMTASVGILLFPLGESDPGNLLQHADVAMYRAKEGGRDTARFFQPSMQEAVNARHTIERGLRQALTSDQLELFYQPQVDREGRIYGAEALVRWRHPERGLISPASFISIAEETGLIYRLGDWVLRTACEHIKSISAIRPMIISVNISPKQFCESGFVSRVDEVVREYGIDPKLLHLEITESMVLDDVEQSINRMETVKSLGIGFSIDDFGTGHSSLAYLKRLPIEAIKIDRSFVRDVVDDPNDAVLVETIIIMAQHLGLDVVAEGVESGEALKFLIEKGCAKFQGYLFSRPVPLQVLQEMGGLLFPVDGSQLNTTEISVRRDVSTYR